MHRHLIPVAVSSCLLGEKVRFDGDHMFNRELAKLARYFQYIPVCPEVDIGLSVPCPPIRLSGTASTPGRSVYLTPHRCT